MVNIRVIGTVLDNNYRDDLNFNFGLLASEIGGSSNLVEETKKELLEMITSLQNQLNVLTDTDWEMLYNDIQSALSEVNAAVQSSNNSVAAANVAIGKINEILNNSAFKGAYSASVQYSKYNNVVYNGSSYVYTNETPSTGNTPPTAPTVSNSFWQLAAIKGEKGDRGPTGENGIDGTSFRILGTRPSIGDLPVDANLGDAYAVLGDIYVWNGSTWDNLGPIQGPQGPQGPPGDDADVTQITQTVNEIQTTLNNHLQENVATEIGAHNLRYFNSQLEFKSGSIWNKIKTGVEVQDYSTGHLDDLTETGFYVSKGGTVARGFPQEVSDLHYTLIEVYKTGDGWVLQVFTYWSNTAPQTFKRGQYLNTWAVWRNQTISISSSLISTSTTDAASSYAVKMVNDKILDTGWIDATLRAGWILDGGFVQYRKVGTLVYFRCNITKSTGGTNVFTDLPVGFLPRWRSYIVVASNISVEVTNDGRVLTTATTVSFDSVFSIA